MKLGRVLAVVLVALVLPFLAGCSGSADSAAPSPGQPIGGNAAGGVDLDGTSWVLTNGPFTGDLAKAGITLSFADGQASGTGGVNQYSGTYTASTDGTLQFGPFAVTEMAGDPDAMALEQEYLTTLSQTFGYTSDGSTLSLFGAADQVMEFSAS